MLNYLKTYFEPAFSRLLRVQSAEGRGKGASGSKVELLTGSPANQGRLSIDSRYEELGQIPRLNCREAKRISGEPAKLSSKALCARVCRHRYYTVPQVVDCKASWHDFLINDVTIMTYTYIMCIYIYIHTYTHKVCVYIVYYIYIYIYIYNM